MARKTINTSPTDLVAAHLSPTGFPWLVIRPAGVDEYATESDARADANGGTVVRKATAAAAPDLLAALTAIVKQPVGHTADDAGPDLAKCVRIARAAIARAGGAK